jgi:hypothetical protein
MRINATISDITHDDLVELLSTALYGSQWIGVNCDTEEYDDEFDNEEHEDRNSIEDVLARILLNGKTIEICDMFAVDENDTHQSKLEHYYNNIMQWMHYKVSLNDIRKGLTKMMKDKSACKHVIALMNCDDGGFDQNMADAIMQYVLFGREVY